MDRVAVFVDAGYVFAAGSVLLAGEKLSRGSLHLDHAAILSKLELISRNTSGLPLLRVYWYDGTSGEPSPQQLALSYCPGVKLRLGFVNQHGQQKGVDSLIVTDLINLARNRAMTDAVLVTGDEDIRVGVQQAQELGVRIHLAGISPVRENQSGYLRQEVDSLLELSLQEVQSFLRVTNPATRVISIIPATAPTEALSEVARSIAAELSIEEVAAVLAESTGGAVPASIDSRLLVEGGRIHGTRLPSELKRLIRSAFLDACRSLAT